MYRQLKIMKLALFLSPLSVRSFTQSYGHGVQIIAVSYLSGGHAMARKEHIVKYTDEELIRLTNQEGSLSKWDKAAGMTSAEVEASVASDLDEAGMVMDWDDATVELPQSKAVLNMRVDKEVLDYFRKTGKGYQSRINAVLRLYVQRKASGPHKKIASG
jgi:uncharacterized protein (DUF4415 family)